MARHKFGGIADYVIAVGADNAATLQPGTSVTCWNAATGGTQHTDLTETDGTTPIPDNGTLTSNAQGAIPEFMGPDGVTAMYLDANGGAGPRRRTTATDLGPSITTVATDLSAHTGDANPHGTAFSDLAGVQDPNIADFIATTPFAIAHRGSGGEFPEHTLRAFEAALAAGAQAIEVSVHTTADGVPVAFHDSTLDRVTDHTGPIADWTYGALREQVKVNTRGLLGSGWGLQDIPTLEEVMTALYGRCVIFLEAKSNASIPIVQDLLLTRYPGAQRSVVWKNYYQSTSFTWAQNNGFTVWGYVDAGTTDGELDTYDALIDMWGVPIGMSDTRIGDVVARGKPVICWEVHRHSEITRLAGLGVDGYMQSQWIYLNKNLTLAVDLFDSEISQPGTLGLANYDPAYALQYDGSGGAYLDQVPNDSVLMGGHKAPADDGYIIAFSMKWDSLPSPTLHSDVAFGKASDDEYQFSASNDSGGYHAVLRANGDIQIYRHDAGVTSGTQLGSTSTETPQAGVYMDFEIEVTATQVILRRTDVGPYTLTVDNTEHRGRYWHVSSGSVNNLANKPYWSNISVAAT